jgi:hypothetical protein
MSAKAIGQYLPFVGSSNPAVVDRVHQRERRIRVRTKVHWPVVFRYRHGEALESVTENLSSQGFYCLSQTPIPSGEALLCWLTVPTHDPSGVKGTVMVECHVRVVRSDAPTAEGLYGIACRIEDYRLACSEPLLSS